MAIACGDDDGTTFRERHLGPQQCHGIDVTIETASGQYAAREIVVTSGRPRRTPALEVQSPIMVMMRLGTAAIIAALLTTIVPSAQVAPATTVRVTRFATNPLVTVKSSATLGGNVNGPTVIRVPSWVQKPLGRYYMYFANHRDVFIRLAYADDVKGPWKIHEPGVWHVRDSLLYRPQPDSARFGGFN